MLGIFILFIIAENLAVYQFIISEFDLFFYLSEPKEKMSRKKKKEKKKQEILPKINLDK